jgi:hypothetical protein
MIVRAIAFVFVVLVCFAGNISCAFSALKYCWRDLFINVQRFRRELAFKAGEAGAVSVTASIEPKEGAKIAVKVPPALSVG